MRKAQQPREEPPQPEPEVRGHIGTSNPGLSRELRSIADTEIRLAPAMPKTPEPATALPRYASFGRNTAVGIQRPAERPTAHHGSPLSTVFNSQAGNRMLGAAEYTLGTAYRDHQLVEDGARRMNP